MDKKDNLQTWKEELQSKKQDIEKRRSTIEGKIDKYKVRYTIASEISEGDKLYIAEQLRNQLEQYENELQEFNDRNNPELTEIEAILKKLDDELQKL